MSLLPRNLMIPLFKSRPLLDHVVTRPTGHHEPRAVAARRGLSMGLVTGRMDFPGEDVASRVFRHRYVLLHYIGLSGPVFASFLFFAHETGPQTLQMPAVLLGLVAMFGVVAAYVAGMCWMLARAGRAARIWLSPGLLLGVAALMGVALTLGPSLGFEGEWETVRKWPFENVVALFLFLAVYVELAAAMVLRGPARRALAEMRAKPVPGPDEPADVAEETETPEVANAVRETALSALTGVLRLEAQGNHVLVVTERGRHLLPGPFGAMVERLPTEMGKRVHRSHWVACSAVLRARRLGRDVVIETVDGARVPVASTQYGNLRGWLVEAGQKAKLVPPQGRFLDGGEDRRMVK